MVAVRRSVYRPADSGAAPMTPAISSGRRGGDGGRCVIASASATAAAAVAAAAAWTAGSIRSGRLWPAPAGSGWLLFLRLLITSQELRGRLEPTHAARSCQRVPAASGGCQRLSELPGSCRRSWTAGAAPAAVRSLTPHRGCQLQLQTSEHTCRCCHGSSPRPTGAGRRYRQCSVASTQDPIIRQHTGTASPVRRFSTRVSL